MPFLAKAQKISILGATENGDDPQTVLDSTERLAMHLRWHGLKPQAGEVKSGERDACTAIVEAARNVHAGLLVMGGYGHSRARELVFGGFTRRILQAAPLPVLVCH
jgi:nucleotide-binding universal stress UspA family protein